MSPSVECEMVTVSTCSGVYRVNVFYRVGWDFDQSGLPPDGWRDCGPLFGGVVFASHDEAETKQVAEAIAEQLCVKIERTKAETAVDA